MFHQQQWDLHITDTHSILGNDQPANQDLYPVSVSRQKPFSFSVPVYFYLSATLMKPTLPSGKLHPGSPASPSKVARSLPTFLAWRREMVSFFQLVLGVTYGHLLGENE